MRWPPALDAAGRTTEVWKPTETGSSPSMKFSYSIVAEFADVADPYLWILKQPPAFLIEALRDGISGLGEHPLAAALAAGRIGGVPAHKADPPGFHPAQGLAAIRSDAVATPP